MPCNTVFSKIHINITCILIRNNLSDTSIVHLPYFSKSFFIFFITYRCQIRMTDNSFFEIVIFSISNNYTILKTNIYMICISAGNNFRNNSSFLKLSVPDMIFNIRKRQRNIAAFKLFHFTV